MNAAALRWPAILLIVGLTVLSPSMKAMGRSPHDPQPVVWAQPLAIEARSFQDIPAPPLPLPPPLPSLQPRSAAAIQRHDNFPGLKPIGSLHASGTVGQSDTGADVSDSDRPETKISGIESIVATRSTLASEWGTLSPVRSVSRHQPTYFDDPNLERYGTTRHPHLQPIYSAAHFGFSAITLPYQMTLQHPGKVHQYFHPFEAGRYGYRERSLPPPDRRAAIVQAASVVGLVFILP